MGSSPVTIDPTTGQPQTLGANGQPLPSLGSSSPNPVNYSQLLPSASQDASFTPLPYQDFGQVPYTQAATVNPASVDLSQMPGALSQYESLNQQALAPQFQQQQDALTANEADRGIFNSTAGLQLGNDLAGQQAGALASANAPLVSAFAGYYNQGEETNAANQQAAAIANQAAMNQSNTFNATAYGDIAGQNMTDYNSFLNTLYNQQQDVSSGLEQTVLNSYSPGNYTGLIQSGQTSAGNAYSGAYNSGAAGTAALSKSLGTLGGQAGSALANAGTDAEVQDAFDLATG